MVREPERDLDSNRDRFDFALRDAKCKGGNVMESIFGRRLNWD